MNWGTSYEYINKYERTSTNQHGVRYKIVGSNQVRTVEMSVKISDVYDIQTLVLLSHSLNVPIHYDFENQMAHISVMSAEAVKKAIL